MMTTWLICFDVLAITAQFRAKKWSAWLHAFMGIFITLFTVSFVAVFLYEYGFNVESDEDSLYTHAQFGFILVILICLQMLMGL